VDDRVSEEIVSGWLRSLLSDYARRHLLSSDRLDVHPVLVLEFDPIPAAIQDHAHPVLIKDAVNLEGREGILQKPVRDAAFEILVLATMGTEVPRVRDGRPVVLLAAPTASRDRVGGNRPPVIIRRVTHALALSAAASNPNSATRILVRSFVEKEAKPPVATRLVAERSQVLKVGDHKARKLDLLPTVSTNLM